MQNVLVEREFFFIFILTVDAQYLCAINGIYTCHRSLAAWPPCEDADARDVVDNLHRSL